VSLAITFKSPQPLYPLIPQLLYPHPRYPAGQPRVRVDPHAHDRSATKAQGGSLLQSLYYASDSFR
jgi:hypothetical protein